MTVMERRSGPVGFQKSATGLDLGFMRLAGIG